VAAKQNFETTRIKSMVTHFRQFNREAKSDQELASAFATVSRRLMARQQELDAAVRAALKPVKHVLTVAPVP
jgi:hypothetical protein